MLGSFLAVLRFCGQELVSGAEDRPLTMIAALGNPRPFDDPVRETKLYFAGDRVNHCKPLRPQPPMRGTNLEGCMATESALALGVAQDFPAAAIDEAQALRRARAVQRKQHWHHGVTCGSSGASAPGALVSESHAQHKGKAPQNWPRARRHLRSGEEVFVRSLPSVLPSIARSASGSSGDSSLNGGSGGLALLRSMRRWQKQEQEQCRRPSTTGQLDRTWNQGARVVARKHALGAEGRSQASSPRFVGQFQTTYDVGVGASHAPDNGQTAIIPTFSLRSSKCSWGTL